MHPANFKMQMDMGRTRRQGKFLESDLRVNSQCKPQGQARSVGFLGALLCMVAVTFTGLPAQAAPLTQAALSKPGTWLPWRSIAPSSDALDCATRQEFAVVEGHLKRLRALWEQVPGLTRPVGFEVRAEMHDFRNYCLYLTRDEKNNRTERKFDKSLPIASAVSMFAFPYVEIKGVVEPTDETAALYFRGNTFPVMPTIVEDLDVFVAPGRANDRYGLEVYGWCKDLATCTPDEGYLVIRNNERPLWKPAPLMRIYDQFLKVAKTRVLIFEGDADKARRDYAEYLTPKAIALREEKRRQFAPAMARNQKKTEAEIIAKLEESERLFEERLRRASEQAQPAPGSAWALAIENADRIAAMKNELLQSNPNASAFLCAPAKGGRRPTGTYPDVEQFRPASAEGCRAVVTNNPEYFDKKLPKTALQLLIVTDYKRCLDSADKTPGGCTENIKLLEGLDWKAVKSLMDR